MMQNFWRAVYRLLLEEVLGLRMKSPARLRRGPSYWPRHPRADTEHLPATLRKAALAQVGPHEHRRHGGSATGCLKLGSSPLLQWTGPLSAGGLAFVPKCYIKLASRLASPPTQAAQGRARAPHMRA
eukprot:7949341-Pyramimonas_sp.AAC.2